MVGGPVMAYLPESRGTSQAEECPSSEEEIRLLPKDDSDVEARME